MTRGSARVPLIVYPGAEAPLEVLARLKSSSPFNDAVPLNRNFPAGELNAASCISIVPVCNRAWPVNRVNRKPPISSPSEI